MHDKMSRHPKNKRNANANSKRRIPLWEDSLIDLNADRQSWCKWTFTDLLLFRPCAGKANANANSESGGVDCLPRTVFSNGYIGPTQVNKRSGRKDPPT